MLLKLYVRITYGVGSDSVVLGEGWRVCISYQQGCPACLSVAHISVARPGGFAVVSRPLAAISRNVQSFCHTAVTSFSGNVKKHTPPKSQQLIYL